MTSSSMIATHPATPAWDPGRLSAAIDALGACAQACTTCADACLSEDMVADLRRCIRTDLDCADVCAATASVLSRVGESDVATARALLEACITACEACGDECASHAQMHEHCKVCAEACRACAQACRALLAA